MKDVETIHLKRQLITSAAIILGSILAAAAILYFLVGNINATTGAIVRNESVINQQAGLLGVIASLKQQATQAIVYQTAMNQLLPTQNGLIDFSQWVAGVAAQYQVTTSVSFQNDAVPPGLPEGASVQLGQMSFMLSANSTRIISLRSLQKWSQRQAISWYLFLRLILRIQAVRIN